MMVLFFIVLGAIAGSALNAIIYRSYKGESWLKGRSRCPKCKHTLCWYELIPVISFVLQKGRCRSCHSIIHIQYVVIELITAFAFAGGYAWYTHNGIEIKHLLDFAFFIVTFCIVMIIFVHDARYRVVLDSIVLPGFIVLALLRLVFFYVIYHTVGWQKELISMGIGIAIGALFFAIQYIVSRGRWVGGGDIRIGAILGAVLGFPQVLTALFFAYISGCLVSIWLLATKKKNLQSEIAFGPFLAVALLVTLLWGPQLVSWYFNFFL